MNIDLTKRVETVGIVLAKRGVTKVRPTRVGAALDVSGSAQGLYHDGTMQKTLDRLLAVAIKFDDDGQLDTWVFDTEVFELPALTEAEYGKYVDKNILRASVNNKIWGGTQYGPAFKAAIEHWFGAPAAATPQQSSGGFFGKLFGSKPAAPVVAPVSNDEPAMLLFITDGENYDRSDAMRILREAASTNKQIYFQMIGIGNSSFDFLEQAADELPNVGFVNLRSLNITDEQLYEQVVNQEFVDWIKKIA